MPAGAGKTAVASETAAEPVDISVVIPCLNEAESIAACVHAALQGIDASGLTGEVLVVDNGSTDGTGDLAAAAGARVVLETRRGYGSAYLRGFREARGRYLVMGDGDGTYDFTEIPRFVDPLHAGEADMVMGSRLEGNILPGAMPWSHRWIGNPILSGMLRLFYRTRVSDSHCGIRSFSREAYRKMRLRTTGMELASEIVVRGVRSGLRIAEVPITYHPRGGVSKLNGLRDAWRHVRFMLLFSPSHLFLLPGVALCLAGVTAVALLAAGPREMLGRTWDYHVLLFGCLAVILGYNLVLFDLFAKCFSMAVGLAEPRQWLTRLYGWFTVEKGLVGATLAVAVGLAIQVAVLVEWARSGYGTLDAVREVAIGTTLIVLGCQTAFGSFLLGLASMGRDDPAAP